MDVTEKAKKVLEAYELIKIQDAAGSEEETRGEVVARLTGVDTSSDTFIAALRWVVESECPRVFNIPMVFEACLNAFAFGVALAAHHKSKTQESANGSERKASGVCESGEGSGGDGRA